MFELIEMIEAYLSNKISCEELYEFAWKTIDSFTSKSSSELPPYQPCEKEFWFSIWQIVHLADEEHEKEGLTKRELERSLSYLKKEVAMPEQCTGRRP